MKNRSTLSVLAVSLATASGLMLAGADASAEQAIHEVGTLTCSLAPEAQATPSEPGQGRAALCHFRPGDKGAEETYVGTFQFIGQEKPSAGSRTIMLVVKVPVSKKITVALLEQSYSADASTGAGKQSPLVGSRDSSVVLQSEATQSDGPTMALGQPMPALIIIADLKLRSSPA